MNKLMADNMVYNLSIISSGSGDRSILKGVVVKSGKIYGVKLITDRLDGYDIKKINRITLSSTELDKDFILW